ncbi:MAG: hypothetical protein II839_08415 [Kiritimatiellae bacterium]|nr:hypothetical protein [Kiritimatiellia bacterium]
MRRLLPFFLVLSTVPALAETWTAGGKENGWNDGANWAEGRAPAASAGTRLFFDAPAGAAFGFGGDDPISFRDILLGPRSGDVSFRAPGFRLGGRPVAEPEIGWILETHGAVGSVVSNGSPAALKFAGPAVAPWNFTIIATNGPVSFLKGLDAAGRPLSISGPAAVTIRGGELKPSSCTLQNVPLVLDRASLSVPGLELVDKGDAGRIDLRRGASLRLLGGGWGDAYVRTPLSVGDPEAARDPSVFAGPGQGTPVTFAVPATFAPGCVLTNAYAFRFAVPSCQTNRTAWRFPAGSAVVARSIDFFGQRWNRRDTDETIEYAKFIVEGPDPKDAKATPTVLRATDRSIRIGGRIDRTRTRRSTFTAEGRVDVVAGSLVEIPSRETAGCNMRATFGPGVAIRANGLSVGCGTSNTLVKLVGATAELGDWGLGVGIEGDWRGWSSVNNGLVLENGASVVSKGNMTIGRYRWQGDAKNECHDNYLKVSGGSTFRAGGLVVGRGMDRGHPVHDCSVVVADAGSLLDAGGRSIHVGLGSDGDANACTLLAKSGTTVTNAEELVVGLSRGGPACFNRVRIQGARVAGCGPVRVGGCDGRGDARVSCSNSLAVAGAGGQTAAWDFGGRNLTIGTGGGHGARACDNEVAFLPGSEIRNLGDVVVGASGQDDLVSKGNVLRLAGGRVAPVKSLNIGPGNTLEIAVDPAFGKQCTRPLGVLGNFSLGGWKYGDCYVRPVAAKGTKPGTYPVLQWKGAGEDLGHLKLHPDVDASRWKLTVDDKRKFVTVTLLP